MNSSCRCPYENLDLDELKLLDEKDLRNILNLTISVLLKEGKENKILQMVALLPNLNESSKEVETITRAIVSWKIRGELYCCPPEVVESIGKIVSGLKEKKDYWTQELEKYLKAQKELKNVETWLEEQISLDKISEVFQIRKTIESLLQEAVDADEELNKLEFWEKHYSKIEKLIETFGFIEEKIKERAENALDQEGRSKTIGYWKEQPLLVSFLTKLGLEEKIKEMLSVLVAMYTKRVNWLLKLTEEDLIKTAVEKSLRSDDILFMKTCLTMAKSMNIVINPKEYQKMADELLILANKLKDQCTREKIVDIACYIYKGLEEEYDCLSRKSIYETYEKACSNYDRAVLKVASKVIPFEYKRQSWKDF